MHTYIMAVVGLRNLCTPALLYFVLSAVAITMLAFQNMGNNQVYCVGAYSCPTSSIVAIFLLKIVYVLFWTWLLNIICKSGYETLSWFLVLLPFILLFILIGILFFTQIDPARHATLNIWSI
jgi:hypothetical protein